MEQAAAPDPRYDLVYQEAVRLIAQQHSTIDNLRTRATFLVSTAAVGVSFLAGLGLFAKDAPPVSPWIVVVLFVLLALIAGCASAVLWPLGWTFGLSPGALIDVHIEPESGAASTVDRMRRDSALWLECHFDHNEQKLNVLSLLFRIGLVLLIAEAGLLLYTVITR